MPDISVFEDMAVPPADLYAMVSDVTRMGEWSPETTQCRWLDGATGPEVGARFRGSNRYQWRRWSTTCTVTDAIAGERFAFRVDYGPVPVSEWAYEFAKTEDGCRVGEHWTDRRPLWMRVGGAVVMGVLSRPDHNREGMQRTLAALERVAESGAASRGSSGR